MERRDNIKDIILNNINKIEPDKYYNTFDLLRLLGTGITPTRNFITKKIPIEKRHVIVLKEHTEEYNGQNIFKNI
ncbi:hypothetical protein [Brachyspira innocens]|uniref:hypothetical protein n=1 Tax=Brachyspira innocens TaxID=13264 RepID=UPI0026EFD236|nr:hypothetical protein [Brachyspira innocens]